MKLKKTHIKKKTLNYFKTSQTYAHLTRNVLSWVNKNNTIINITAPVKSGKRYMAIITHLHLLNIDKNKEIKSKSYFITSLYRKDDVKQRDELSSYGFDVVTPTTKKKS